MLAFWQRQPLRPKSHTKGAQITNQRLPLLVRELCVLVGIKRYGLVLLEVDGELFQVVVLYFLCTHQQSTSQHLTDVYPR